MGELHYGSPEEWHAIRAKHVGGSEVAALFGVSPYLTRFTLWHAKARGIALAASNERIDWGLRLEPVIAQVAAEERGWEIEKCAVYLTHPSVEGMGATLDYYARHPERGVGILEVKCVDWLAFKQGWGETRAPTHIGLQVQHQLACTGFGWAVIACLVGGNDLRYFEVAAHAPTTAKIEDEVVAFWQSIADAAEPAPTGLDIEYEFLRELYPDIAELKVLDLDDVSLAETARMMKWAGGERNGHEKTYKAAKTVIFAAMGDAALLRLPGGVNVRQKGSPARRIFEVIETGQGDGLPAWIDAAAETMMAG